MKSILCVVLFTLCLCLQAQGNCHYKGENLSPGIHERDCIRYTCHEDGRMSAVGCPVFQCQDQIGYQDTDLSKPYPDCCAKPICKD